MNQMKKGLLAVSFGTSVNETREKTIDAIERELAAACPDCQLYRAWTSRMIIRKLKLRDQGKTILLASHNEDDIHILCNEIHRLDGGSIME